MTDFDIDVSGWADIQESLDDLEDDWTGQIEYKISVGADYGKILEYGRGPVYPQEADALKFEVDGETVYSAKSSGHPPYPFFWPAVTEFQANPRGLVRDNLNVGLDSAEDLEDLLLMLSLSLERQIKINANARRGGRSPGTHPSHPVVDTGNLVNSVSATRIR